MPYSRLIDVDVSARNLDPTHELRHARGAMGNLIYKPGSVDSVVHILKVNAEQTVVGLETPFEEEVMADANA